MDAAERLLQFIDYKGFGEGKKGKSLREFYNAVSLSHNTFKTGRSVSSESLNKIVVKFPELNVDWVITGRGEMILQNPMKPSVNRKGLAFIITDHFWKSRIEGYSEMDFTEKKTAKDTLIDETRNKIAAGEPLIIHRYFDLASTQIMDDLIVRPYNPTSL